MCEGGRGGGVSRKADPREAHGVGLHRLAEVFVRNLHLKLQSVTL